MVKILPESMRSTITEDADGLRIIVPIKRNIFLLGFLSLWLCGWFAGESAAVYQLLSGKMPVAGQSFLMVWLAMWTFGGGFAIYAWLNIATGREVIHVTKSELVIRREVLGIARPKEYDMAHVAALRTSPGIVFNPMDFKSGLAFWGISGGAIAFDYGAKTYHFGRGLEEAEARQIVSVIHKWLEQQNPAKLSAAEAAS